MEHNSPKKGIGYGGKTLAQMLDENERLYGETGFYYGLKDLPLQEENPLKLEVFHERLLAAAIAGRETTRMISASPQVREVAELAVALYTPEGDCVLQSTGIIIHIPIISRVLQWMIRNDYEDEEGIHEGDCFTSNDVAIAGMHTADVYDIQPVFWEGELIGWVATVIMEGEIGALLPGCMPCDATDRFVDGIKFTAEKSAVNDRHLRGFERKVRLDTRMPDIFMLDRKGALAADAAVRKEVGKIVGDVGIDYYMKAIRELIEIERRTQLERVKRRTVPGKFHSPSTIEVYLSNSPVPPHHKVDRITLVPWDFHIRPDGTYFLDFDGTGNWGWHIHNCTPSAIEGAACMMMTQTISYTGKSNHGTFLGLGLNAPENTFVSPGTPHFACCNQFAWPEKGSPKVMAQQSHAFFCRGYLEEVRVGNTCVAGGAYMMAGQDHLGNPEYSFLCTEVAGALGGGAFAIRDGLISEAIWQPDTDMGNVEIWELMLPMVWVGRRLTPDSYGYGQYRGGPSMIATFLIYKTPMLAITTGPSSQTAKILPNMGMFGGYCGPTSSAKLITNANTRQLIDERKPLAHGNERPGYSELEQNIKGDMVAEIRNGQWLGVAKDGDILQCFYAATGAGFGDPVNRDPALARKDLNDGFLTIETCRKVYGIDATYDPDAEEWTIDEPGTAQLKEQTKKNRLAKGIPTQQWWRKRRQDLIDGTLPQLLRKMYNESLANGQHWPAEFRGFWCLPDDFTFKED